jgi:DhnA family fructose-bisphosphate aldolase class Ia
MSVNPRLNRLFAQNGKCLQVALDHGLANEYSALSGVENLQKVVGSIAAANPDGMILTIGQAHWLQDLTQKPKPALVLRADAMNVYTHPTPKQVFSTQVDDAVEQAVALDAAAIVVDLFWLAEHPDLHRQCLENVLRFKPLCERYGMPLIVEPMVLIPQDKGGFKPIADIRQTVALARLAVELGADIVKADIDENVQEYHQVVEAAAPRPLLPRGGAKVSDQEILTRTHTLLQQGAAGVIYGRNIFQHAYPERMVRACQAMIHEGASVAQAMAFLG